MPQESKKHGLFGRPRDFMVFFAVLAIIGLAAAFHWHWLDLSYVVVGVVVLVLGSVVVLWRAWRHRGEPGGAKLGQLAALPTSWRKWVLGETNTRSKK
jgi:D-alanyl-lipoteichoic acid acyltransferase DltB (MBOAT superfamily)